jgi:hypothetical protein
MIRRLAPLALAVALASPGHADFVPEIPGLERLPPDARAAAMAGAGIASCDESSALILNPASIALIRRSEALATITYQRRELTSGYFGADQTAQLNSGTFSSGGFVYPVPVYRGALAIGFLYDRLALFDRDLLRAGTQPSGARERELLEEHGSLGQWAVGAGLQVSPRAFLGASLGILAGSLGRVSEFTYGFASGDSVYRFRGDENLDVSGFRGSLGGLFFPTRFFRLGFRLDFPYTVRYEGTTLEEVDDTGVGRFRIDEEVSYPFSIGSGVAARAGGLLLTAEGEFLPYSLLELEGARLRTVDRREGYRDVLVGRFGAEYALPFPFRLRAGFRREPDPFRLILVEVRGDVPTEGVMESARIEQDRHALTGGVGWLMEDALNVDLSVEWVRTERTGTNVDETDELLRFMVTTAYRF